MSLTLFDVGRITTNANADPSMRRPAPYQPASETSREAAHKIAFKVDSQNARVAELIRAKGAFGMTAKEVEMELRYVGREVTLSNGEPYFAPEYGPNVCSRVFNSLKKTGEFVEQGKRGGGMVLTAREAANG
jgi:hypothetical protein